MKLGPNIVVAARIGNAEIEIGGFGDIPVGAQMLHGADVAVRCVGLEDRSPESPRNIWPVASRKIPFGAGRMRSIENSGVVDAILAADQILRHQRAVGPGQHVVVQRVDLAECGAHLADLSHEVCPAAR